jgi:hypothetical protein
MPLTMDSRGEVVAVDVYAYGAGRLAASSASALRTTATDAVSRLSVALECEVTLHVSELGHTDAFGDGAGVLAVARTSHGCLLSGSAQVRCSTPPSVHIDVCSLPERSPAFQCLCQY